MSHWGWTFPPVALGAVALAWTRYHAGWLDSAPIIVAPVAWLLLLGVLFAVIDFAEDGIFGNARDSD